jgi:hypothetical protein
MRYSYFSYRIENRRTEKTDLNIKSKNNYLKIRTLFKYEAEYRLYTTYILLTNL